MARGSRVSEISVGPRKRVNNFKVNEMVMVVDPSDLEDVEADVDKILSEKVRPDPTEEKLIDGMNTYRPKKPSLPVRGSERGLDRQPSKTIKALPEYIQRIPEGEEKKKAIKAAAQAAILLGQPSGQIALQYNLSREIVALWEETFITMSAVGRRDRISDMLMIFIEQELKSLMAISIVTSREDWILKQEAGDLSQFVSAKSDRILMLLSAFGRAEEARKRQMDRLEVISQDG